MRSSAPLGIKLLAFFFAFGATMSWLTAFLLLCPGTPVDAVWRFNPEARHAFQPLGMTAVVLMVSVCAACIMAGVGLWRVRKWGYWTALTVLGINLIGDTLNFVFLHDWRTLIGLPIGGAMIAYLVSRRDQFRA
jgi:uncharacterized membrane protein (DUF2068 family)